MGLIRSMEHLKVDNKNECIEKSSNKSDWENWDRLKISAFHGKKLIKRNFQPYCPKGERFFLHEIDNFNFDAEKKVFIVGQTFRRLFGTNSFKESSESSKGRKYATKLTFLREKGKQYFRDGKLITDLIDFPQSYWEALEALKSAQAEKKNASSKRSKLDISKEEDELLAEEISPKKRLRSNHPLTKN